jgi:mRNA-degrading endonuclease toxin of MazEF toxin-antitoxin module
VDGVTTKVLVEQLAAIDITRLGALAGHLDSEEQWGVDSAILTVLGLN